MLRIKNKPDKKLLVVNGIKYSYTFFDTMCNSSIINIPIVITKIEDGTVTAKKVIAIGKDKWKQKED